ncbi:MAG: glycosyltransferase [Bacteroidetes bacterium]|nr:glycosyltransferase [Bacteroidota bacterium]
MKPKKVLHISTARSWRGGEQQIAYLVQELKKLGLQQHIACIKDAPLHQWALQNDIPVLALRKSSSIDLRFSYQLKAYSKKEAFDIWHAHDAHAHGFAVYAQHFFKAVARLIVSRRVDFPVAKSKLSAFKYNHPCVYRYLAVSDAIADILRSTLKNPNRVFTVHSANNPQRFENPERGKIRQEFSAIADRFWVGNVAALTGHKDLFTFLDTAKYLVHKDPQMHFFIAGTGELENELKAHAANLELDTHCSFLGFRDDVPSILADLDCFLFSSEMEGLGTSVLDAFASKTPVVATNAGGIPEMVKHEESGLICAVKDYAALGEAVLRIKNEAKLREQIIEGALLKLKDFSPQKMAESTISHYQA